jgi:hypothetical protein
MSNSTLLKRENPQRSFYDESTERFQHDGNGAGTGGGAVCGAGGL